MRITVVRGFAAYLATFDPAAEVPPASLLPGGTHRAVPYLYSAADIAALLAQAEQLKTPLRRATIKTLIGLMAVTGMRRGEAIALDDEDFDARHGLLLVRHAKLGKHRLLPLHPTTVAAVQDYRRLRDQRFPRPVSEALLVSSAGTRLLHYNVGLTFTTLTRRAGLAGPLRRLPSPAARSETFICGCHAPGLVPRRRRRRGPGCRCCRPTSATPTRPAPTGITPISGLFRYLLLCAREEARDLG